MFVRYYPYKLLFMNKFERFFIYLSLITIVVVGVGGSIYMVVYGVTSDDTELNILTWNIIIIFGGLFLGPAFFKFSEFFEKKKLFNKNQAHWFSLIPLTPLLVGLIIGAILYIIGVLSLLL